MAGQVYELYYETDWLAVDTVDEIMEQRAVAGYTWVLYTLPSFIKQGKPGMAALLEKDFETVRVFPGSLNDGEIIVARSKSQPLEKQ